MQPEDRKELEKKDTEDYTFPFLLPWLILRCLVLLTILLLFGMLLSPGPVDQETHRFRFVSDGFLTHRWVAVSCLVLVIQLVWLFCTFASRHGGNQNVVFGCGVVSVIGFSLVIFFPEGGPIHYLGAMLYIVAYVLIHILLYNNMTLFWKNGDVKMVYHLELAWEENRVVAAVAALCLTVFGSTLLIALTTEEGIWYTVSAIFEYAVVVCLLLLSLLSVWLIRLDAVYYLHHQSASKNLKI